MMMSFHFSRFFLVCTFILVLSTQLHLGFAQTESCPTETAAYDACVTSGTISTELPYNLTECSNCQATFATFASENGLITSTTPTCAETVTYQCEYLKFDCAISCHPGSSSCYTEYAALALCLISPMNYPDDPCDYACAGITDGATTNGSPTTPTVVAPSSVAAPVPNAPSSSGTETVPAPAAPSIEGSFTLSPFPAAAPFVPTVVGSITIPPIAVEGVCSTELNAYINCANDSAPSATIAPVDTTACDQCIAASFGNILDVVDSCTTYVEFFCRVLTECNTECGETICSDLFFEYQVCIFQDTFTQEDCEFKCDGLGGSNGSGRGGSGAPSGASLTQALVWTMIGGAAAFSLWIPSAVHF